MSAPHSMRLPAWIRFLPAFAGVTVVAVSGAVLIGWVEDVEWLRSPATPLAPMQPTSAGGFVCLGLALLLATARPRFGTAALRWLLELAVLVLGLTTLAEYAFQVDFGIDRWLFPAPLDDLRASSAARMSVLGAICFVLLPCALFAEHAGGARGRASTRTLATCVGIAGLLTTLGYVYGAPPLYQPFAGSTAMSPLAAVELILLGVGIIALHPEYGLPGIAVGRSLVGTHVRWLLPAVIVVPLLVGIVAVQSYQSFGGARVSIAITAAGTMIAVGLIVATAAFSLRRMEERLAVRNRALAATKQGVFIADGDETNLPIVYVNEAFTQLTGYSKKEALGNRCDFLVADTPDAAALEQLASALAGRSNVTVTLPSKRRDGTVFSARWSVSTVPGSDERKHLVGLIEDVTSEQLAAMSRLELLAEASQARKDAESANRVKDVFFASITHELRSPLNACTMWLDVLALGPLSDKSAKAVDAIKRNLKLQTRLVNDLIDAAKISSGGIEIHREPCELERLVEANIETWRLLAAAKNVRFSARLPERRHVLDVDSERLTQVLNNLLENAFSHTPAGGHVALRVQEDGGEIAIEVEDTGTGLSAEDLERVFTPFWRADSTKSSHKGLGLGLAIAENLIKGHQGTLRVRSGGLGMGCVFTIRLPNSSAEAPGGIVAPTLQRTH